LRCDIADNTSFLAEVFGDFRRAADHGTPLRIFLGHRPELSPPFFGKLALSPDQRQRFLSHGLGAKVDRVDRPATCAAQSHFLISGFDQRPVQHGKAEGMVSRDAKTHEYLAAPNGQIGVNVFLIVHNAKEILRSWCVLDPRSDPNQRGANAHRSTCWIVPWNVLTACISCRSAGTRLLYSYF
jgi:hypothetical protein